MHITKIKLANFKRFSDLTIDLSTVQPPPKLVLLIGANGSGKSSVFDAFERFSQLTKGERVNFGEYYKKDKNIPRMFIDFDNGLRIEHTAPPFPSESASHWEITSQGNIFYGRSAFRQTPRLKRDALSANVDIGRDSDRPRFLIDIDQRFENDVVLLINKILGEVFNEQGDFDAKVLRERYINPINQAFSRIFGEESVTNLSLTNLSLPSNGKPAQITFKKGSSTFEYELLSSGEKEVFGILLNLLVRRKNYQDTIYFIDELDVHLNTSLQYALLKEITENWIPENCQFWTASHSLGFIQYARESENAVILDFDQFDFDLPQTLLPQPKENLEVYEIAVPKDMLSEIFKDKLLTFCENEDVTIYNSIGLSKRLFLPAKDKNDVYFSAKNNPKSFGIMDKDFLTPQEIQLIRQKVNNLFVLNYYSIESYLYHPENLAERIQNFDIKTYKNDLEKQKQNLYEKVIYGLKQARDSYKVLALEKIKVANPEENIFTALRSADFEDFYPYLDMKKTFKHGNYNISKIQLAQTNWIEQAISKIFDVG